MAIAPPNRPTYSWVTGSLTAANGKLKFNCVIFSVVVFLPLVLLHVYLVSNELGAGPDERWPRRSNPLIRCPSEGFAQG